MKKKNKLKQKTCFLKKKNGAQCACTVSGDNLFPTTNELNGKGQHGV